MNNSFAARLEAKGEGYTYFPVSAVSDMRSFHSL